MPEIITKQPETVIAVLKSANMECGKGTPKILTTCPIDRFCHGVTGTAEICVYTPNDLHAMTQMTSYHFLSFNEFLIPGSALAVMIFLVGMLVGTKIK